MRYAVEAEYPLNTYVRDGLNNFQKSLGLKAEDVEQIEYLILTPKQEAEQLRQKQEAEKLRQKQEAEQLRQKQEREKINHEMELACQQDDFERYKNIILW